MRTSPALGPYVATVREWLIADKDVPRKQRHTARRVWRGLVEEEGAQVAESSGRAWMFVMRLSHSGKPVHIAYANQAQESFVGGHVRAFERLGGVPRGMIRYDNLKPAVIEVALGRERLENPRFIAMRSHYGFDSGRCHVR